MENLTEYEKKEVMSNLWRMVDSMVNICILWEQKTEAMDKILCDNFPFDKSFDEMLHAVMYWKDTAEENLEKM